MTEQKKPVMPLATIVWLIDNTKLTFAQLARFIGVHVLEIQAIADGEVAAGIVGVDPVASGQLTRDEIKRCEDDPAADLSLNAPLYSPLKPPKPQKKYTPVAMRRNKLDAIAWLVRHEKEMSDSSICRLLGTTRPTIKSIREGEHWDMPNLQARHPVELGLCTTAEFEAALAGSAKKAAAATPDAPPSAATPDAPPSAATPDAPPSAGRQPQ